MKKTPKPQKNRKVLNHYSAWKYVVLITTVIILTLSAIPTWFGEQPSIQVTFADQNNSAMSVVQLDQLLKTHHIPASKIIEKTVRPPLFLMVKMRKVRLVYCLTIS